MVRYQVRQWWLNPGCSSQEVVASADLWSVQLRVVLYAPCMLCCADNSDDVHGGVR